MWGRNVGWRDWLGSANRCDTDLAATDMMCWHHIPRCIPVRHETGYRLSYLASTLHSSCLVGPGSLDSHSMRTYPSALGRLRRSMRRRQVLAKCGGRAHGVRVSPYRRVCYRSRSQRLNGEVDRSRRPTSTVRTER